jgi:hypothetical protein
VILDESIPKVYGLEGVKRDETIYVTEGPFDSTFVQNAIAMCGSDILLDSLNLGSDIVYVLDNEPRNKTITKYMNRAISENKKMVIWPDDIEGKDVNCMILDGYDVHPIVENHTFTGLELLLRFNHWRR